MPDEQAPLSGTDRLKISGEQGCAWSDRKLGSLCELVNGFAFEPSDWEKDGAPIIRIQNLNGGGEFNFFRGALSDRYRVGPGDLLFSWSGNRGTSFGPFIWGGPAGYLNQHIFRVLPRTGVTQRWLYHALHEVRRRAEKNAHGGSGLVHVKASDLVKYKVLTPAEEEQRAIADVLDAVDAAIRETESLIAKLKRLRLGLIDDLLSRGIGLDGSLRPLSDLRNTVIGKKAASWSLKPLGSLADLVNGFPFKPSDWLRDGIPIIRIQNLNGGDEFNFAQNAVPGKYHVFPGDLLFSWSGNRGTSFGPFLWGGPFGYLNQHIFKVLPRLGISPRWLYFALDEVRARAEKLAHGGSGLVHVKHSELVRYELAVPKIDEQEEIANRLAALQQKIETAEHERDKAAALRDGLRDDLLTGRVRVAVTAEAAA